MAWMKTTEALGKLPALFLRDTFSFSFDGIPLVAKHLSRTQTMNLRKLGMQTVLGANKIGALPAVIQIEPTNICNLRCPLCPAGGHGTRRRKGFMSMATFRKILDELGEYLIAAILYGWGEPFLHRHFTEMIGMCTSRNILTVTSTNGHFLQTRDDALRVVDAGLSALVIALDGATQAVYETYRKGGDVEKVKRCLALVEEAKAKRGSDLPYTNLRVVVTRANRDDLPNIEQVARDAGVNMFSLKTVGMRTHSEEFKNYEPDNADMSRFEYDRTMRRVRRYVECPYPFRQPTIFWDGTVVGCEFDYDLTAPWGTVAGGNFADIWNGDSALNMRRAIRTRTNTISFCESCPYQDRIGEDCVVSSRELRPAGS